MASFFDELENNEYQTTQNDKPFWAIWNKDKNDPDLLKWLNDERTYLTQKNRARFERIEKNLLQYKGIMYTQQETRQDTRERWDDRTRAFQKIVINQVYDLTESRIARRVKYKPFVEISPLTDDVKDKFGAKECQSLVEHIQNQEKFADNLLNKWVMNTDTMGEAYLFGVWDPFKGSVHPEYKKLKGTTKNGPIKIEVEGKMVEVNEPVHIGDVGYELEVTTNVLVDWQETWEKANYLFRKKVMHIEEVKNLWPETAMNIKESGEATVYNYATNENEKVKNSVEVWYFWHKATRFIPEGALIVCTPDAILEKGPHPFKKYNKKFPCVRLTDIDRPAELHGDSFITHVKPITGLRNTLTNMIVRNQILCSHPKWMMPAGSAKLEQLGNDITIVQYKGPVAPVLVQSNPTPSEIFKFREDLQMEAIQTAQLSGVSQGQPPAGVKAGVALQWISEQENERFNRAVLKFGAAVVETAELTLGICSSMYDEGDDRVINVLGKDQAWKQKVFDIANLDAKYDIRIRNSSALPREKPARIQTLMDLNERFPDKITGEQVLDQLDLAQDMKYLNIVTVSVNAAEVENNDLLDPQKEGVPEPDDFEDHIVHWRIHAQAVRNYGFKVNTAPELQERMKEHVMAHELLMWERAKLDQGYMQKIAVLEGWPMFFKPDVPEPVMEAPPIEELQQMNIAPEIGAAMPNTMPAEVAPEVPSIPAQLGVGSVASQVES